MDAILVAMEQWTVAYCVLIVETFFKNCNFVVTTRRLFHWHFHIPCHAGVPSLNTIHLWIQNCRSTASTAKKKPPVPVHMMRTPLNIKAVSQAVFGSPHRLAKKRAAALHLSHDMKNTEQ
jgi:hypothetical protein